MKGGSCMILGLLRSNILVIIIYPLFFLMELLKNLGASQYAYYRPIRLG